MTEHPSSSKMDTFTQSFFWVGFVVFLLASIAHMATYFRHFDPNVAPGGFEDIANWVIAYALATVIDLSDLLVSIAMMKVRANGATWRDLIGYWVFIVFIMALSWFINWQYNLVFGSHDFAAADSRTLFAHITVGQVNPIIGSAFQLLLLVYTGMAHKFSHKAPEKTAKELEAEATELEQKMTQQKRLNAVKHQQRKETIGNVFGLVNDVKEQAKGLLTGTQNEETVQEDEDEDEENAEQEKMQEPVVSLATDDKLAMALEFLRIHPEYIDNNGVDLDAKLAEYMGLKRPASARFWKLKALEFLRNEQANTPVHSSRTTDPLPQNTERNTDAHIVVPALLNQPFTDEQNAAWQSVESEGKRDEEDTHSDDHFMLSEDLKTLVECHPKLHSWLATGQRTATVDDIITMSGFSRRLVQNRVKDGTLKVSSRNANLVRISSVIDWLKAVSAEANRQKFSAAQIAQTLPQSIPAKSDLMSAGID